MKKEDTALFAALGGLVLIGSLALASGSVAALSAAQMNDVLLGRIFYIIAIFESNVDFGIWRIVRRSDLKFGWEVSYGVLQSRADIGMTAIVRRYLELIDDSRKTTYGPAYVINHYWQQQLFDDLSTSADAFQAFVRALNVPVRHPRSGQSITLKDALTRAGREDTDMRIAQIEYFYKDYFKPAFRFADSHGLKYPVSRLIVCGATIINGYSGMKRRITPYLKGGNELQEMSAAVAALNAFYVSRRHRIGDVTYRTKAYAQILSADPNMRGPLTVKGRNVPTNVTLSSLASGATPSRGSSVAPSSFDMGSQQDDLAYTSWMNDDAGWDTGADNDLMFADQGFDDSMGWDDLGGDFGLAQSPAPTWYRGPGYYTDPYGRIFWMR